MLLSNGTRLGSNPGKLYAFTNALTTDWGIYTDKGNWNKTGSLRNFPAGEAAISGLTMYASRPSGNTHPVAWVLAQKPGRISSHSNCFVMVEFSGQGELGRNLETLSCVVTIDADAIGQLVVGGEGLAVITVAADGTIFGTIGSAGLAEIEIGAVLSSAALAWLAGNGAIEITGTLESYAIGWMEGTTAEAGMTPAGIAAAVWNAVAASFDLAGTMGERLNDAGGGSSPADIADAVWDELQAGHVIPESFGDLVAFIRNVEGGKWRIVGNQMIFYKADNTTEVARFNLFDSAGNPAMTSVFERRRT